MNGADSVQANPLLGVSDKLSENQTRFNQLLAQYGTLYHALIDEFMKGPPTTPNSVKKEDMKLLNML